MKTFRPFQHRSELMLLPPSIDEWVPAEHEVRFFADAVRQLDLSTIMAAYNEDRGAPPYHPTVMVGILLYAYARGVRGSRRIERMCREDVAMRFLSGNSQPDHWTISEFRRRHLKELGELFTQTVQMAKRAKLVKMGHLAIDGTKLKANASKHSAMSYGRMKQERDRLHEQIMKHLCDAVEEDERENRRLGDQREGVLPPELVDPHKRLARIKEAMAALEAEARAAAGQKEAVAEGLPPRPKAKDKKKKRRETTAAEVPLFPDADDRPAPAHEPAEPEASTTAQNAPAAAAESTVVPKDKAQYNFTDPESRIMLTASKAFDQCYNAQAAVDASSQIITAADLTNLAADAPHLCVLIDQAIRNTGWVPAEVSADAGYFQAQRIDDLTARGIDVLIPPEKIRHSEWRAATPPRGRPPKNLDTKGRMRRKLRTRHGRQRYLLRQQTAEPVFGQIKWNRNLKQLLLRGLAAARASWRFECAVHNLLKIHRAGVPLA